jgi:phosphoglycolate phosphatase-like HAD superfamily hydrolase
MHIANLIFDFDGTLVDSKRDIANAQLWVLHQLGVVSLRSEDLYRFIGRPLEVTFSSLLPQELHTRIPEAARMYSEYYPAHSLVTTELFTGVRSTLETLVERGYRLSVASTKKGVGIKRVTDHFAITHLFAQLQGSDGIPFKPAPDVINLILEQQQWDRAATMMVGDTDLDVLAGKNAGVATSAVTYGSLTEDELRATNPDFILRSFPEILDVVQNGLQ